MARNIPLDMKKANIPSYSSKKAGIEKDFCSSVDDGEKPNTLEYLGVSQSKKPKTDKQGALITCSSRLDIEIATHVTNYFSTSQIFPRCRGYSSIKDSDKIYVKYDKGIPVYVLYHECSKIGMISIFSARSFPKHSEPGTFQIAFRHSQSRDKSLRMKPIPISFSTLEGKTSTFYINFVASERDKVASPKSTAAKGRRSETKGKDRRGGGGSVSRSRSASRSPPSYSRSASRSRSTSKDRYDDLHSSRDKDNEYSGSYEESSSDDDRGSESSRSESGEEETSYDSFKELACKSSKDVWLRVEKKYYASNATSSSGKPRNAVKIAKYILIAMAFENRHVQECLKHIYVDDKIPSELIQTGENAGSTDICIKLSSSKQVGEFAKESCSCKFIERAVYYDKASQTYVYLPKKSSHKSPKKPRHPHVRPEKIYTPSSEHIERATNYKSRSKKRKELTIRLDSISSNLEEIRKELDELTE
ncbi:hypothetical protein ADUPG1_013407 [Aduncisulcus paluster]|nr:hypothetical protein ADUPG1_013407 [Aduncisulcus paluster]